MIILNKIEKTTALIRSFPRSVVLIDTTVQRNKRKEHNLIPIVRQHILKTAVIYGANASGKSNLIKAMAFMCSVIENSLKLNPEEPIVSTHSYPSFQLHSDSAKAPLEMEVSFLSQDIYYRYGFALDANRIHRE